MKNKFAHQTLKLEFTREASTIKRASWHQLYNLSHENKIDMLKFEIRFHLRSINNQ